MGKSRGQGLHHTEFNRDGMKRTAMSIENPAVSYCLLETNQTIGKVHALDTNKARFYKILSEVHSWERVEEIPAECDEWYHVQVSILGKVCVMDIEIGRRSSMTFAGFLKVNYIDDTDK